MTRLGLGYNTSPITVTTQIGIDTDWSAIVAGESHGIARKTNGTIWDWGMNDVGQVGQGHFNTPIQIPTLINIGTDWGVLGSGFYHVLAIRNDGTLWGWGQGDSWELTWFASDWAAIGPWHSTAPVLLRIDPAQE